MAKTQTAKSNSQKYSVEQVLRWYEQMLLMRKFEEKAGQLYGMQKIKGFCHLYIGQEAVAAGIESAITPDDYIITAYREHGNALARGVSANAIMAELYGKATGCSKGKGGSMHMFSKEHNFLGGHGIVGGQIPLGAGVAFAIKYRKEQKVCITMFGDGAARQGALHEAFNMANTWQLPVVFIVENNFYAMGTSVERTSNVTELYRIGLSYDIPSWQVDGMSVIAVHEEVSKAVQYAKEGKGPSFLEIRTYRYKGHSMSDPAKYRTKEELEKYKDLDPIANIKSYILSNKLANDSETNLIEERVKLIVQESVDFAENSPYPEIDELYRDVYIEPNYPFLMD